MSYNATPTFYTDLAADGLRQTETLIAAASWETGGAAGASNASGLGIDIGGGSLPAETGFNGIGMNWTLKDQEDADRTPQVSQVIGGYGYVDRENNVVTTWDQSQPLYTALGAASSGGVSGGGDSTVDSVYTATNPDNLANGTPNPVGFPTITGDATLADLTSGWSLV